MADASKPAAPKAKPAPKRATTSAKPAAAKKPATKAPASKAVVKATPKASTSEKPAEKLRREAASIAKQAGDKAKDAARQGKARATDALDDVSKLIGDAAGTVDEKLGADYGDYVRKAAEAVTSLSSNLKKKEIEDLIADTRDFVKKSPAVAIGAAAAVGFILTRLVKAGGDGPAGGKSKRKPKA